MLLAPPLVNSRSVLFKCLAFSKLYYCTSKSVFGSLYWVIEKIEDESSNWRRILAAGSRGGGGGFIFLCTASYYTGSDVLI